MVQWVNAGSQVRFTMELSAKGHPRASKVRPCVMINMGMEGCLKVGQEWLVILTDYESMVHGWYQVVNVDANVGRFSCQVWPKLGRLRKWIPNSGPSLNKDPFEASFSKLIDERSTTKDLRLQPLRNSTGWACKQDLRVDIEHNNSYSDSDCSDHKSYSDHYGNCKVTIQPFLYNHYVIIICH